MTNVYFNQKMQNLMKQAWTLVKVNNFTMSEAMKQAWKVLKLRKAMHHSEVSFVYKKKDGSTRLALGTTNVEDIPSDSSTFAGGRTSNPMQVRYYDLGSKGWRSFSIQNLI